MESLDRRSEMNNKLNGMLIFSGLVLLVLWLLSNEIEAYRDRQMLELCQGKYDTPKCHERYEVEKAQAYEEAMIRGERQ